VDNLVFFSNTKTTGETIMWSFLQPLVGPIVNKLVDLIPDPNARAKAKEEFERELLTAVTQA